MEHLLRARPFHTQPLIPHDSLCSGNYDCSRFTEETGSGVRELL